MKKLSKFSMIPWIACVVVIAASSCQIQGSGSAPTTQQGMSNDEFKQQMGDTGVVMVEFSATWCEYCADYAKKVDQFTTDYAGKVTVIHIDYDQNETLDYTYGVTALPTTIFFKNGQQVETIEGDVSEAELKNYADPLL